jgi:hypothetical protein
MPLLESQPIDFYGVTDGIDTISSSLRLTNTKWRDAQNVNYFPIGGFSWRQGYEELNSSPVSADAVTGLYMARFSTPANVAFMTCGTKLYKMDSLDGTWDDITGAVTITAGKNNLWNFASLNDIVVLANDTDTCIQVPSSLSAAVLAGTPAFTSALFPIEFRGYMFYCNTVESATRQPDRLRFSDLNAPNSFTMLSSNNFIDIAKKQGGDVRGGVVYDGRLYIFKRSGIYSIEFQPTRVNSSGTIFPFIENANPVVEGVGTQSHRSIVKFTTPITHKTPQQELVFFVDQFGVPRLFDGAATTQIGYTITKSRDTNIKSLADMDKTRNPQIFAVNYPERSQILCWMTEDDEQHDTCWVFDYSTGFAWNRFSFADDFNCGALFENVDGTYRLYLGDYAGTTYEYDTTQTDNGTAITSYVTTGDSFIQSPMVLSNWIVNEIRGVTGTELQTVSVAYYVDGEDTPSVTGSLSFTRTGQPVWAQVQWGQFSWAKGGIVPKTSPINLDAKTLRVKFSNSTSGNTASIEGFGLLAKPQGWRAE